MSVNFSKCNSVLITGASRGLGLQMVKQLVNNKERPKKIITTARNPAAAQELQQIAQTYPDVYLVPLDVVSETCIEAAAKEVTSIVGSSGLNCLINNAGIFIRDDLTTVTQDNMMTTFQCNTIAPLFITKAFLPLLQMAAAAESDGSKMTVNRAAVINISSLLGSAQLAFGDGAKFKSHSYKVSKSALNMVTRCLAADLESDGILCMSLHPGWVKTDMGGQQAPLTPEESISSLLTVISALSEKDHGAFLSYDGSSLPW